jgi:hypothetical protein
MHLQTRLKAEKLKLAKNGTPATRPMEVDFSIQHDLRKHSGIVHKGDIHIGSAAAHLTGAYAERGESMVLNLTLVGPDMPVQELEGLLPALGIVLPAELHCKAGAPAPISRWKVRLTISLQPGPWLSTIRDWSGSIFPRGWPRLKSWPG